MASIPTSFTFMRWSAETAPNSAANSAEPEFSNSSACSLGAKPLLAPSDSIIRACSILKYPFSQNTSLNLAIPCRATAGSISSQINFTYLSGSSMNSTGIACAPMNVATISILWLLLTSSITLSDLISDSVFKPYPDLHSIVVVPTERNLFILENTRSNNSLCDAFRTSLTLLIIPPPLVAISL